MRNLQNCFVNGNDERNINIPVNSRSAESIFFTLTVYFSSVFVLSTAIAFCFVL